MVIVAHVLIILFVYLLAPFLPPIQPRLPRPQLSPHKQVVDRVPRVNSAVPGASSTAAKLADEQAPKVGNGQAPIQQDNLKSRQALHLLYTRVAARSLGEGSFALAEIACTIKNRLRVSRASLSSVLRAYRARDIPPQPYQIEIVRKIFEGESPCPASWWYALSLQDTKHWRPHQRPPVKIIKYSDRKQILIFDR